MLVELSVTAPFCSDGSAATADTTGEPADGALGDVACVSATVERHFAEKEAGVQCFVTW